MERQFPPWSPSLGRNNRSKVGVIRLSDGSELGHNDPINGLQWGYNVGMLLGAQVLGPSKAWNCLQG